MNPLELTQDELLSQSEAQKALWIAERVFPDGEITEFAMWIHVYRRSPQFEEKFAFYSNIQDIFPIVTELFDKIEISNFHKKGVSARTINGYWFHSNNKNEKGLADCVLLVLIQREKGRK